jgi:iron complex outermembrane receptor protein
LESGFETNIGKVNLIVTAYGMFYNNQLVLTGKVNDVGAYTRTNIANSYRTGVEIETSFKLNDLLKFSNNLALSRNKIKTFTDYYDDYDAGGQVATVFSNTNIAFSPSVVNNATLSILPWKNGELKLISKYVGAQFLDNTSRKDRRLDAFMVNDLQLMHSFQLKQIKSIDLFFQLNNFLNAAYAPNGYTYSYQFGGEVSRNNFYFPMAGINIMTGLTINL